MAIDKKISRLVTLTGTTDIIFDRYVGKEQTSPDQKLYLDAGKVVCLPALNIISFLTAQNTDSAPKILCGKSAKSIGSAFAACASISPNLIPFTRNGKPIVFDRFTNGVDSKSGIRVRYDVARLPKGIPNEKERPVLGLPWQLTFTLTLLPNATLSLERVENVFIDGMAFIGLGSFRKVFGKSAFSWE